jgi:hypothetical protein
MLNFTENILDNIRFATRYYKAVYELSLLSPNDLESLGLTYGEIPTAVYKTMLKEMNNE